MRHRTPACAESPGGRGTCHTGTIGTALMAGSSSEPNDPKSRGWRPAAGAVGELPCACSAHPAEQFAVATPAIIEVTYLGPLTNHQTSGTLQDSAQRRT